MKKAAITFLVFAISYSVFAQEENIPRTNSRHKKKTYVTYKLMTNPIDLMVQNINLTTERVFYKHTIGLTLAFKPAIQNRGEISTAVGMAGDYKVDNAINHAYNAISAGINSKRYFHPQRRKNIYMDGQLLYRYWWFDNKNVSYPNVEGYRFNATRTEKVNVYDGKVLFGCSLVGRRNCVTKVVIDFFGGLDVRFKAWEYDTYNGTVNNTYHSYLKETGNWWFGSPYIGMQFGLGR